MRVRKVAKQLKRWLKESTWDELNDKPVLGYNVGSLRAKHDYIVRMSRRHYFGLRDKFPVGSMMWNFYTHKACSYYLYEEILSFWGIDLYE